MLESAKSNPRPVRPLRRFHAWLDALIGALSSHWRKTPAWTSRPRISIVAVAAGAGADPAQWALYSSLTGQTYANWELIMAIPSASAQAEEARRATEDPRVIRIASPHSQELVRSVLAGVGEGFYLELQPTDELHRDALHALVDAHNRFPDAAVIYSDVACMDASGQRTELLKPAWNPELFRSMNYVGGFVALHRHPAMADLPIDPLWASEWLSGVLFRLAEQGGEIRHIPQVLLTRQICDPCSSGNPCDVQARAALLEANLGKASGIRVELGAQADMLRLRYPLPQPLPRVTLIIPTRDGGDLLKRCVDSILEKTRYDRYSVLLVDNNSVDPGTLRYLGDIQQGRPVRVMRDERSFNYSAINNRAVASTDADVICLLNDDVEVIAEDWLAEMVSHAVRPGVGAVGAKLLYPDGRIQHAGIVVGMRRSAAHGHKGYPAGSPGYMGRLQVAQDCTAVTGACLAMRRDLYLEMGGLNERDLAIAYNDVDLCLRLREAGLRNIWTPYALLYHHESASRGREDTPAKRKRLRLEADYMNRRWGMHGYQDPCYNPGLTLDQEDFSPAVARHMGKRRLYAGAR